jgi:hypothetical protein
VPVVFVRCARTRLSVRGFVELRGTALRKGPSPLCQGSGLFPAAMRVLRATADNRVPTAAPVTNLLAHRSIEPRIRTSEPGAFNRPMRRRARPSYYSLVVGVARQFLEQLETRKKLGQMNLHSSRKSAGR